MKESKEHENYASLLFLGLWMARLLLFIPGTPLVILGGVCFSPIEGFLLSTAGQVLSGTFVYIFSRSISGDRKNNLLADRHPELNQLLKVYNYRFLALGIVCPIAPTDVICFLSASMGIKYSTYILTILIANIPLRMLYSFVGISLTDSIAGAVLVIGSLVLIFASSIKIWNTLKHKQKTELQHLG